MKTQPNLRFAAVYIRVSTEEQTELSPESQMEKIQEYAKREGIVILTDHVYVDAGISGKKAEKRPAFMRMIADAKDKDCPFTVLLLWKFSRFARNQEESIFYKSILRSKCGVDVVSISEPLIAGHFGSLIERIIEWMDEFYSVRLSEEVKRSMEVNARRGKLQSNPSFGYRVQDNLLVPEPEEAELVRKIFSDFNAGKGLFPIAKELNAMGVKTHRGNSFENRTVEYILRNPVYVGKLRWNPTGRSRRDFKNENIIVAEGGHEPLVTQEVWDAAQRRMDEVKLKWGYKARPSSELKHWLSGLVRCSACGATLLFSRPCYFKCGNYTHGRCIHSQHIKADLLAEAFVSKLSEDVCSSKPLKTVVTYTVSHGSDDLARLESAQKLLQSKKSRLQEAYLSGVVDLADFAAAKKEIEDHMSQVAQDIQAIHSQESEESILTALRSSISSALETIRSDSATMEQKNNAARSIIDTCSFDKQTMTLSIVYSVVF